MSVPTVVVLGGGPDAERPVSLASASAVAEALRASRRFNVIERTIDRPTATELAELPADVFFPALHGPFGEGGPLQDVLDLTGAAYVGSGSAASRLCMDKVATKARCLDIGLPTPTFAIVNAADDEPPIDLPVVVKPVHDGSSVGLHLCRCSGDWGDALAAVRADPERRSYMAERLIDGGRELTVALIAGEAMPIIEIVPASGVYDYEAKYERDDTRYVVEPELPAGVAQAVVEAARALGEALGVRHVARVDFMLDEAGEPWVLEVNTMPGFTSHSLVPKAAAAVGVDMPGLCARLVELAMEARPAPAAAER